MAQDGEQKAAEAAQKAYAAAAEGGPVTPSLMPEAPATAAQVPVDAPAKVKAAKVKASKIKAVRAKTATTKPIAAAPVEKVTLAPRRKPVNRKQVAKPRLAKPAAKSNPALPGQSVQELKEKIMATTKKTKPEYAKLLETAQAKAKGVYAKGSAVAGEVSAFSKGNVEAVVASGKILGAGVQALGKDYVTETKGAVDTLTADLKALAAVKSPTELFQLQGKLARRNFDQAVAFSSKTSESLVKLANEVFAPISNRVSLAVDKISKAA